jgi:hypothetical protein
MVGCDDPVTTRKQVEPRPFECQPFASVQKQQRAAGALLDQFEIGAGNRNTTSGRAAR